MQDELWPAEIVQGWLDLWREKKRGRKTSYLNGENILSFLLELAIDRARAAVLAASLLHCSLLSSPSPCFFCLSFFSHHHNNNVPTILPSVEEEDGKEECAFFVFFFFAFTSITSIYLSFFCLLAAVVLSERWHLPGSLAGWLHTEVLISRFFLSKFFPC